MRITSLRPRVEQDGAITVQMTVAARSVDDIEEFMANLERRPRSATSFRSRTNTTESGLVLATLEGKYAPAP